MYRFLIVIEKTDQNFSAYAPDLPGCVATGKTREETERNMHEAIQMHIQGMIEDKKWKRMKGHLLINKVITGVRFIDGIEELAKAA